ncbi:MAG TPA: cupin domain-containing protein [Terriglobales bacterium]|nr:cupin domain-containing protein [Terriglobales bacterium]
MDGVLRLENRHTGETLRMRRERDASGQVILIIEGSLPPQSNGPPPHVHFQQREEGRVQAGTLGARIGKQNLVVQTGGSAAFPAGVVHSWWNVGENLLEFSGRVVPAVDLDQFLQALFAVLNASATGRPSIFYLVHVLWRHRRTQGVTTPPVAIQRILFPVILLIGHVFGKYKGQAWPGCPETCTGAPLSEAAVA